MTTQHTPEQEAVYLVSVVVADDKPENLALQSENHVSRGSALADEFPAQWFENAIKDLPIVVARRAGRLVGYLVSSAPGSTQHLPLPQAKQRAYPGGAGAYRARGHRLHPARQCRVTSRSRQVWIPRGRGVLTRRCRISGGVLLRLGRSALDDHLRPGRSQP